MVIIRIHHKSAEEQASMRDDLCRAMVGWSSFINNDVIVSDTTDADPEPVTTFGIGPDADNSIIFDVKAEDMMCMKFNKEQTLSFFTKTPALYAE